MSSANSSRTPGRWILMTTFLPLWSVARWTCATDAEPSGVLSTVVKSLLSGCLSSVSMMFLTVENDRGVVSSRSRLNASQYSWGMRSGLMLSSCPSLMYAPPNSSIAARILCGSDSGFCGFRSVILFNNDRCHLSPYAFMKYPSPCCRQTSITLDARLKSSNLVGIAPLLLCIVFVYSIVVMVYLYITSIRYGN